MMTDFDGSRTSRRFASRDTALQAVTAAKNWVATAKITRSPGLVACAEQDLQAAVDEARELGVQWGQIGLTLGIARGNAYQRYRKKASHGTRHVTAARSA